MIKFLPIGVLIILVLGSFLYIRGRLQPQTPPAPVDQSLSDQLQIPSASSSLSDKARIDILEKSVDLIAKQVSKLNSAQPSAGNTAPSLIETKLKNLETTATSLQDQINQLKNSPQVTPASSQKSPVYIPLGSGGTSGDRNWINANNYQAVINTSDYSGYTGMQLEVIMNLSESVGTANVKLYNISDSSSVSSSSVSTTSNTASLLASGSFTLPSGSKSYVLQVQSTEGYTVYLQSARIKVNF